jgi:hypothetical protein
MEEEADEPEDEENVELETKTKYWGRRVCNTYYLRVRAARHGHVYARRLPRCVKGRQTYLWQGRGRCNFLGGRLAYQTRHLCHKGSNDAFRRITRCRWFLPRNTYFHTNVPVGGMSLHRYRSSISR